MGLVTVVMLLLQYGDVDMSDLFGRACGRGSELYHDVSVARGELLVSRCEVECDDVG
jgi:hypothetical protein